MHDVLVVDDDPHVRESLCEELGVHFHVESASSGEEALERLAEKHYDALVCDVRMPGMGGVALLQKAAEIYPGLVRIFLTGYADENVYQTAKSNGAYKLRKPWGDELELILRNALGHKKQLSTIRDEIRSYLSTVRGLRNTDSKVSAEQILDHLRESLSQLDWVKYVHISPVPAHEKLDWTDVCGPTQVPGRTGVMEQETFVGLRSGTLYRLRVGWLQRGEFGEQVIALILRQTEDVFQLRELADELRDRSEQLEAARMEMVQRDRLSALAALAASVAHDVRSPLAVLAANQSYIEEQLENLEISDPEVKSAFQDNRLALDMISQVLESLRLFSSGGGESQPVDIEKLLALAVRLLRRQCSDKSIRVEIEIRSKVLALAAPGEVCQILINLL